MTKTKWNLWIMLLKLAMSFHFLTSHNQTNHLQNNLLDSDLAVVDDTWKLWCVGMEEKVVVAPEYCHANFTQYFTGRFWSDTELARTFQGRNPRYFSTGVLGGDKFEGKCRNIHPGPIHLLHWSGKGKPRQRLDSGKPCIVDHLWAPYDLYSSSTHPLEE